VGSRSQCPARRGGSSGRRDQIGALAAATGTPVTLIGWSRDGLIAREAARIAPKAVRMVITLGSPFAAPSATNVGALWKALAAPLAVPCTSIYSRADGVVAWRACLQPEGPQSENVEVRGSHLGLGFNPAALWVIADRLAQPLGTWTPFRPSGRATLLFPRRRGRCRLAPRSFLTQAMAALDLGQRRSRAPGINTF
jgi:pimeloyl-ACP methyl ester carboxylesterase